MFEHPGESKIIFAAFELENSDRYELAFTMSQFEELFLADPELRSTENRDARYHWVSPRPSHSSAAFFRGKCTGEGGRQCVLLDKALRTGKMFENCYSP